MDATADTIGREIPQETSPMKKRIADIDNTILDLKTVFDELHVRLEPVLAVQTTCAEEVKLSQPAGQAPLVEALGDTDKKLVRLVCEIRDCLERLEV